MRTIGYTRVSTQEQGDSGLGLQAQAHTIHEHHPDAEIIQEVATGKTLRKRPKLTELLENLQPGDTLVAARLDRLARSTKDAATIWHQCQERGVNLKALDMPAMEDDLLRELVWNVLAFVAAWEGRAISQRTKAALAGKGQSRPERRTPQESLDRLWELHAAGVGVREIARVLELEGWPTGQGGRWFGGTVSYLLRCRFVSKGSESPDL